MNLPLLNVRWKAAAADMNNVRDGKKMGIKDSSVFRNLAKRNRGLSVRIMRIVLRIKKKKINSFEQLKDIGMRGGMKVLDFGCGIGNYSIASAQMVGPEGRVVAVDRESSMLADLNKELEGHNFKNIDIVQADSPSAVSEEGFDIVLLIDLIHLLDNPQEIINAAFNKLKPDGRLIIKFEHYSEAESDELLEAIECKGMQHLFGKFWALTR